MKTPTLPLLLAALSLAGSGPAFAAPFGFPGDTVGSNLNLPKYAPNVYADDFIGPLMPGACHVSECVKKGIDPLSGKPMTAVPPEAGNGCTPWHPPCKVPEGIDKKDPAVMLGNNKTINYGPNGTIMICNGECHIPPQMFQKPEDVTDPDFLAAQKAQKDLAAKAANDKALADANKKMWGQKEKKSGDQTQSDLGFNMMNSAGDPPPPAKTDSNGINPDGNLEGAPAVPPPANDPYSLAGDIQDGDPYKANSGNGDSAPVDPAAMAAGQEAMRQAGRNLAGTPNNVDNSVSASGTARVVGIESPNKATGQLARAASLPAGAPVNGMWDSFLKEFFGGKGAVTVEAPIAPCYRNTMGGCKQGSGRID